MTCPLQNFAILSSFLPQNQALQYSRNSSLEYSETPFFNKYINFYQSKTNHSIDKEQQIQNSFQLDLLRKKMKEIEQLSKKQIQKCRKQISDERIKKESEMVRQNIQRNSFKLKNSYLQAQQGAPKYLKEIGTNTQPDPRDDQIRLLKELLNHQSTLNKHLLLKQLHKQSIYEPITIN